MRQQVRDMRTLREMMEMLRQRVVSSHLARGTSSLLIYGRNLQINGTQSTSTVPYARTTDAIPEEEKKVESEEIQEGQGQPILTYIPRDFDGDEDQDQQNSHDSPRDDADGREDQPNNHDNPRNDDADDEDPSN
jgi:hypothetical protein